jgi:hypothetical protein
MIDEHKRAGKISKKEFHSKMKDLEMEDIEVTEHTFFRLNERQRKIYEGDYLKKIILEENPLEIWKEKNENLAVFYKLEENRILKIIIRFSSNKVYIVTFYILNKSQIKDFENG